VGGALAGAAVGLAVVGCPLAGDGRGDVAQSRAQLDHALAKASGVDPFAVTIFGGVFDPRKLRFPLSRMPASDARDWDSVHAWAGDVAQGLTYGKSAPKPRDLRSELQRTPR
jgi:hypothetical protein